MAEQYLDPDLPPLHLRPSVLVAVALGALVGTTLRYLIGLAAPTTPGAWPTATLVVNLVGAFALGLLLEALTALGPDLGRLRIIRLGIGSGLLGSFTTYSALALDTVQLLDAGHVGAAAAYAVGSVAVGLVCAAAGMLLAQRILPGSPRRTAS